MPYTQTQYDELLDAIATGALTVKHGDKFVTYRSLDEMMRIAAAMAQSLLSASARRPIVGYASHSRGDR